MKNIEEMRLGIERDFVGFSPSTTGVKPVHIANGLFRTIYDGTYPAKFLNQFVFSETVKGEIPKGHELETIYKTLEETNKIDTSTISRENLQLLRRMMKMVIGADGAVFNQGMASYSAGYHRLLTRDSIGQDGGELIALCLKQLDSALYPMLQELLGSSADVITILSAPLLDNDRPATPMPLEKPNLPFLSPPIFKNINNGELTETGQLWSNVVVASNVLSLHLERHPNKLFKQRLAVLFVSFLIIRHLANLEAYYAPDTQGRLPAFLLDFSATGNSAVSKASLQTYTRTSQSIVRFYGWAFGEQLRKDFASANELSRELPPSYKEKGMSAESDKARKQVAEAQEIWEMAKLRAQEEEDAYSVFGEALYDMLATQASADPIKYIRKLGLLAGIFYPPNQSTHRFVLKQDVLEMLIRSVVEPGEAITMMELQNRLWLCYGIIVGGRFQDEQTLRHMGIFQVDRDALVENQKAFANALRQLDFAQMLADGVLQVGF